MSQVPGKIENEPETPYDNIIPTGWLTAYGRTFSDIAYAQEVFDELENIRIASGSTDRLEEMKDVKLAPQFEARYKIIGKLLQQTGVNQILEVASGLSTRGLEMTSDEAITYVEVDLPAMVAEKRKIFAALVQKAVLLPRPNLHIEQGSAVDLNTLLHAARHFDSQEPIAIINEGLLRYLSFEDKATYADNVKALLNKFGGVWVTSDISLPKVKRIEDKVMKKRRNWISEITGRDITKNLFNTVQEAELFFENLGFQVESHSFLEVIGSIVSPEKLKIPINEASELLSSAVVFVMKIDK